MVERLLAIRRDNDITAHEYSLDVVYDPHTDSLRQSKQEIRGEQFKAAFQPKLIGRESVLSKLRLHEQVE